MAMTTGLLKDPFRYCLLNSGTPGTNIYTLDGGSWKTALYTSTATPNLNSDEGYNRGGLDDANEVSSTLTGYTTTGIAETGPSLTVDATNNITTFKFTSNPNWTAGSAGLTANGSLTYDSAFTATASAYNGLWVFGFGTDVVVTSGNDLDIVWSTLGVVRWG